MLVQSREELRELPQQWQLRAVGHGTEPEHRRNRKDALRTLSLYADVEDPRQTDAKVSANNAGISLHVSASGDPLIVFAGGLPRSSYNSKHTVSCFCENEHTIEGTRHVAFDFTTAVIDFFTIDQVSHDGCRSTDGDSAMPRGD